MKSVLQAINYTGAGAFIYALVGGIAAQIGLAEINVGLLISSIGGFTWIIAKSIIMFKNHAIEAAEKQHDMEAKRQINRIKQFEIDRIEDEIRKKRMQEMFNITTVTADEDLYQSANELYLKYHTELEKMITEKRKNKTKQST